MTTCELSDWLINKISCCYTVKSILFPDSIFFISDKNYIRKLKLNKINNQNDYLKKRTITGTCLFNHDIKLNILFINYEIWRFFEKNYSFDHEDIRKLMISILKDNTKLNKCKILPEVRENLGKLIENYSSIIYYD